MKKILALFLSFLVLNISNSWAQGTSSDMKQIFDRYIFDGYDIIRISFPFVKECSEEIKKYLAENNFTYQLSETFEQLKEYCSTPYSRISLTTETSIDNFDIKFGRTKLCEPYAQYCKPSENELFQKGYIQIPKNKLFVKTLRKIKRKNPIELGRITSPATEISIPIGNTFISEKLPNPINISLTCEKLDGGNTRCSFWESTEQAKDEIKISASINDFASLDRQIKKEHNKKSAEYDELRRKAKKECPGLYRTLNWAQQTGYIDPIVGMKTAQRFDELDCGFWLNQQMY